ncbi:OB-fold protein [Limnobaculum parvum]|uniref:tRNA_anti-like n=1 Tax=Limnobaculum parvum TaxID=2172103 RepID=A0A2Y9U0V0_9GAMM|nr:hypothetical protein [Limnobaculum parvum]AWH89696.1 hypothetical protein HYN51_14775 [Limnobaculum parvum]
MKKVLKWIVIIFVALMVIGFFAGKNKESSTGSNVGTSTPSTESPKPVAQAEVKPEIYKTTAKALFNDYEENEVAVDEKMKGKLIEVKGVVQAIDKDFLDNIIINLRTSNEFMPARMTMDSSSKSVALNLKKGQTVVITCEKMSRLVGSPSGRDCIFNQ